MTHSEELRTIARSIIDSNRYMTLATADETGLPWLSPVWYAPAQYREFFWVSSPQARHSRNLATRPHLAIVIFDSTSPAAGTPSTCRLSSRSSLASTSTKGLRSSLAGRNRRNCARGRERTCAPRPPSPLPRHRLRALRPRPPGPATAREPGVERSPPVALPPPHRARTPTGRATERERAGQHRTQRAARGEPPDLDGRHPAAPAGRDSTTAARLMIRRSWFESTSPHRKLSGFTSLGAR
jgi:hypothetical protein